jgi:hypothetical protein
VSFNWLALFRSIELMRRVAVEVGDHLGYRYPQELEQRVLAYLRRVKEFSGAAENDFSCESSDCVYPQLLVWGWPQS